MEILGFMTVEKQMASRISLRKLTYSWTFKLWMNFSELWTSLHQHCINPAGSITLNVIWTMKELFPKEKQQGECIPQVGKFVRKSPLGLNWYWKTGKSLSADAKSPNQCLHWQHMHSHHSPSRIHSWEMKRHHYSFLLRNECYQADLSSISEGNVHCIL